MKANVVLVCFIILITISCKRDATKIHKITEKINSTPLMTNNYSDDIITINNEEIEEIPFLEFNNMLKSIKYVGVKSCEPVGGVYQMMVYDDRVYMLDNQTEKVFIFGTDGRQINIIDSKGGGPKEYVGLGTMCISRADKQLIVSDRLNNRLLYHTLDGQFLRKVKGVTGSFIESYGNKVITQLGFGQSYSNEMSSNFNYISSIEDSVVYKAFPILPIQKEAVVLPTLFYNNSEELLCLPLFSDTVYQFDSDSTYRQKYVIKQKKSFSCKSQSDMSLDEKIKLMRNDHYSTLKDPFLETDSYISYAIQTLGKEEQFFKSTFYYYDKKKGKSFVSKEQSLSSLINYIPSPTAIYQNQFVGYLPASTIKNLREIRKKHPFKIDNEELRHLIDSNTEWEFIMVYFEFK